MLVLALGWAASAAAQSSAIPSGTPVLSAASPVLYLGLVKHVTQEPVHRPLKLGGPEVLANAPKQVFERVIENRLQPDRFAIGDRQIPARCQQGVNFVG